MQEYTAAFRKSVPLYSFNHAKSKNEKKMKNMNFLQNNFIKTSFAMHMHTSIGTSTRIMSQIPG